MRIPEKVHVEIIRVDSEAGYSWVAESLSPPARAEGASVPEALALLGEAIEEIWDGGPEVEQADIAAAEAAIREARERGEEPIPWDQAKAELCLE